MTRSVTPIRSLARRLPEAGRIRTGVKSGKAMKAIPEFRFTSHDEQALHQVADIYGGEVRPWSDPKANAGQFELITKASEIKVVLPPDPLGGTPIYELWGGGGCDRRCDGVAAEVMQQGAEGPEPVSVPCICDANGVGECKVVTRLSVILPEVRFGGVWRLDTKSWNAAQELPGMVDIIQELQSQGLAYASLTLAHRQSLRGGQRRKFILPVLSLPASIEQLAAGAAQLGANGHTELGAPSTTVPVAAIEATGTEAVPDIGEEPEIEDGEIVDAVIVDAEPGTHPLDLLVTSMGAGSKAKLMRDAMGLIGNVSGGLTWDGLADHPQVCAQLIAQHG